MYQSALGLETAVALFLLPVWLLAALMVGRVAPRRATRGLRRAARVAVGFLVLAELLVVARLATLWALADYGWVFVTDRLVVTTVLLLVPAGAAAVSVVRLIGLARRASKVKGAPVPAELRAAAAARIVVVPAQVAALAALAVFLERFLPPEGAFLPSLLGLGAVLWVAAMLLVLRARWRARRMAETGGPPRASVRVWGARLGVTAVLIGLVTGLVIVAANSSRLPDTYDMMAGTADLGGGPAIEHAGHGTVSVTHLAGPEGDPDREFTLTAQEAPVRLSSGAVVTAWTFNGQVPGPELRIREGELVEITLLNRLPGAPVTVHWHGMDVPNREDGVAGVTQDAVAPGASYTYRFRAEESGTRWYHSHQAGSEQVRRGLFGPLVIEPARSSRPMAEDISVMLHDWDIDGETANSADARPAIGISDTLDRRRLAPGATVRLRLTNTDKLSKTVTLTGTPYRVSALDGTDLNGPAELTDQRLVIGAASRIDLEFTMPAEPVRLVDLEAPDAGILFSPDGSGDRAPKLGGPEFDPMAYGSSQATPLDAGSAFDRSYDVALDEQFGWYDGQFAARMTVNGAVFPDAPMHLVAEGDLVRMRFTNRGDQHHPIHVHGHHFLVLARNGARPTGSPVWLDTLNVRPGEIFEIGFRADNPGVWMDHCHNFAHARTGMVLHLVYEHVATPFVVGGGAGNQPQ